jgi:copper chaperone NosL
VFRVRVAAAAGMLALMAGCDSGTPQPAVLDTRNDACAHCRMTVSDARFAAQIVAPGEEARFFDDIGCLRAFLQAKPALATEAVAFVASYKTKAWVRAADGLFLQHDGLETPMGSHIVAFEDAAGRDADAAAREGRKLTAADVFGTTALPRGAR